MNNMTNMETQTKPRFEFFVESDWTPSVKGKNFIKPQYLIDLADASSKIAQGQSIPISVVNLKKYCGWSVKKSRTGLMQLRTALKQLMTESDYAGIRVSIEDDTVGLDKIMYRVYRRLPTK